MAFDLTGKALAELSLPTMNYEKASIKVISAKSGDSNSRFLKVSLFDYRGTISLTKYTQVILNATLPDGSHQNSVGEIDNCGEFAICEISGSMLAQEGKITCDIHFIGSDSDDNIVTLTSPTFYIRNSQSQANDDSIAGSDDYTLYADLSFRVSALENTMSPDVGNIADRVSELESQVADILYEPISITSFTHNAGVKEFGSTVTEVTLSWELNKTPDKLYIDEEEIDVSKTSKRITGLSITYDKSKTWTLKAVDDRNAEVTKSTTITFCNGIYYGVGSVESGFNSEFVTSLSKRLQSNKAYDFTVTPKSQYIYYAVPTRLGAVTFKVGGFEGGFESPETVSVTNSSNYTESYYVYRSTNKMSGSTSVDVT